MVGAKGSEGHFKLRLAGEIRNQMAPCVHQASPLLPGPGGLGIYTSHCFVSFLLVFWKQRGEKWVTVGCKANMVFHEGQSHRDTSRKEGRREQRQEDQLNRPQNCRSSGSDAGSLGPYADSTPFFILGRQGGANGGTFLAVFSSYDF